MITSIMLIIGGLIVIGVGVWNYNTYLTDRMKRNLYTALFDFSIGAFVIAFEVAELIGE